MSAAALAADTPGQVTLTEVQHTGVIYHFKGPVPKWTGGAFVTVAHDVGLYPEISLYGRNGRRFSKIIVEIPEAGNIRIRAVARASDGTIVGAGSALDNFDGGIRYLAVLSTDGKLKNLVRTGQFVSRDVAFASDGTIWAVGWERTEDGHEKPEYMVVRRYSPSGKELGSFLPKSALTRRPDSLHGADHALLLSAHDRIGLYSGETGEYIEFSNDGQITTRVASPPVEHFAGVPGGGLCGDGTLYVSNRSAPGGDFRLWTLNRAAGTWNEVSLNLPYPWRHVLGCDDEGLVMTYSAADTGPGLVWLRP